MAGRKRREAMLEEPEVPELGLHEDDIRPQRVQESPNRIVLRRRIGRDSQERGERAIVI